MCTIPTYIYIYIHCNATSVTYNPLLLKEKEKSFDGSQNTKQSLARVKYDVTRKYHEAKYASPAALYLSRTERVSRPARGASLPKLPTPAGLRGDL